MNCAEFKIWMKESDINPIKNPGKDIQKHIDSCSECANKRDFLLQTYRFMDEQSISILSTEKSEFLLGELLKPEKNNVKGLNSEWFMRIAAVLVLAMGLLLGLMVGNRYLSDDDENAYWTEEFAVITGDFDKSIFE